MTNSRTGAICRASIHSRQRKSFNRSAMNKLFALLVLTTACSLNASVTQAAMDSAEICTSHDERQRLVRPFGESKSLFAEVGRDPRARPDVKENYSYMKDPAGLSVKNEVDKEMFELMAEPFGALPIEKSKWLVTSEGSYQGNIKVFDELGKHVGTFLMSCNSAIVEY
jgi:hypothetical protein